MSKSMKQVNRNRCSIKKYIRFERELLNAIDNHRLGTESFSAWVKSACRNRLNVDRLIAAEDSNSQITHAENKKSKEVLIVQMHEKGMFNQQIAKRLNEQGVEPLNGAKKWTRASVSKVIKEVL
ncbi:MAG: DUF3950 domain-containing protein [Vibrio sp.]|uniref:DUF3950 domain-containing protein n=1 Tax=Vibrio sp. TaxID=678 RepID=UPI003A86933E